MQCGDFDGDDMAGFDNQIVVVRCHQKPCVSCTPLSCSQMDDCEATGQYPTGGMQRHL